MVLSDKFAFSCFSKSVKTFWFAKRALRCIWKTVDTGDQSTEEENVVDNLKDSNESLCIPKQNKHKSIAKENVVENWKDNSE